jgi:hypothetical protein
MKKNEKMKWSEIYGKKKRSIQPEEILERFRPNKRYED